MAIRMIFLILLLNLVPTGGGWAGELLADDKPVVNSSLTLVTPPPLTITLPEDQTVPLPLGLIMGLLRPEAEFVPSRVLDPTQALAPLDTRFAEALRTLAPTQRVCITLTVGQEPRVCYACFRKQDTPGDEGDEVTLEACTQL